MEIAGQETNNAVERQRVDAELIKKEEDAALTARLNRIICLQAWTGGMRSEMIMKKLEMMQLYKALTTCPLSAPHHPIPEGK